MFAELGEFHEIENVHAEQERTEDDGNNTNQDQELPHHNHLAMGDSLEREIGVKLLLPGLEDKQKKPSTYHLAYQGFGDS